MTTKPDAGTALTREYPAGTVLFEENEPGSRMYVIRHGRVRIYRRSGENEVVLAVLGPGDFFGEMAILEDLPRSANAEAIEPVALVEVDAETLGQMLRTNTEIAVRMMRKLASRVRELDVRLQNLLVDSGLGRAIEVLRWLSAKGQPEGRFVRLDGPVVHIAIAAQTGISPQETHRIYEKLTAAGCLREDGKDVLVAKEDILDDFCCYLDLKRRFDPTHQMSARDAASEREKQRSMRRLLKALQIHPQELEIHEASMSSQYQKYLSLRRRFEKERG